ncbi:MAG: hypothetical protein Q7S49_02300 [bacterium]|nr:hypothetical protein [bacterium]
MSPESLLSTPSRLLRAVLLNLFIKVAKMILPAPLPISLEVSEAPAIAHPADPEPDGALVEVATFEELMDGKTVRILAALAVVLPRGCHLTRDPSATISYGLPINIMSEQPADDIEL